MLKDILLRPALVLVIFCLAPLAADQKHKDRNAPAGAPDPQPADLTWPLPPDPPRVRWVTEYSDLAKVKKPQARKSGLLEKLAGTKTQDEKLELRKPYGVVADKQGRIYTADTELKTVFVIDPQAHTVEQRGGTTRAPLTMPVGVALDAEDRLFVSDASLHSIVCFTASGRAVAVFGTASLGRPGGIAIDRQRQRLYAADAKEGRIAVFDTATFKLVGYFGKPSPKDQHPEGTFFGPTNVTVDRYGMIYVSDTLNYRIQVLDPAGKFIRAFGAQGDRPGEFIRPKGIAVDSEGHVYVADAEFNNFQILTAEGQPLLAIGTLGTDRGQFALLAGLFIDAQDRIYTTEMFHARIQVFQYLTQAGPVRQKGVKAAPDH